MSRHDVFPAERIVEQLIGQILAEEDRFSPSGSIDITGCMNWSDGKSGCPTRSTSSSAVVRIPTFCSTTGWKHADSGVEADGVVYHRFDEAQVVRDRRKNDILAKIGLPLLRLSTDGSSEKERIVGALDQAMQQG